MTDNCPHCGRDFKDREHFEVSVLADGSNLIHYPYSLVTGYEDPFVYDGVLYWMDSEHNGGCGWAWMRWTENLGGPRLYALALERVTAQNEVVLNREEFVSKAIES